MARERVTRETMARPNRQVADMRDIPADQLPPDMDIIWATETVHGQYQEANMTARLNRDGYVPLTIADVPAFKIKTLPGRERDASDDLIRNGGGQVLLGRPKEWGDEDREAQVAQARAAQEDATRGKKMAASFENTSLAHVDSRERTVVRRERARPQFPE